MATRVISTSRPAGKRAHAPVRQRVPGARKIVNNHLPGFSRQLAAMLSAGMPIVACLNALEEQTDNKYFKPVIARVRASIENGMALSDAMRQFPTVFDDLYCNMIAGGESSGELAETIARLSAFLEEAAKLRRKVKSAMMYPVIVLSLSITIAVGLIIFVVPVFGEMFEDFDQALPGPTQFLLDLSGMLQNHGIYVLAALILLVFFFRKWKTTPSGAYAWDGFMLKLPVFGALNRLVCSARFARTLGQMTRSGVPILKALEIVGGATGNLVAGKVVRDSIMAVEKGEPLSSALVQQKVYPIGLVRMLQAGEKTGSIDDMMDNIAAYYEDEVDSTLSGLTSLLEPLLMIVLGLIIGSIVVCMFLPIFKMGEIVGM